MDLYDHYHLSLPSFQSFYFYICMQVLCFYHFCIFTPSAMCQTSCFLFSSGLYPKTFWSSIIHHSCNMSKPQELPSFDLFCYVFVNTHATFDTYISLHFQLVMYQDFIVKSCITYLYEIWKCFIPKRSLWWENAFLGDMYEVVFNF